MKTLWSKLPWWGKLIEVLVTLGLVAFVGYFILKYIIPIFIGLVVALILWAWLKAKPRSSDKVYYKEEEEEGSPNEVHIYHHKDPSTSRSGSPSRGLANSSLYQVNVNKKGAEFIGGKMRKPRLW